MVSLHHPKSAFVMHNTIVFHFEHEKDAEEYQKNTKGCLIGKDHHDVLIPKPHGLKHVRTYIGTNVCGFVFSDQAAAKAFYNFIHQKGVEQHVCKDETWRVYVPAFP
jgi:hypothetical protein